MMKSGSRNLRTLGSEVLVLAVTAYIYSLSFPGFTFPGGLGLLAFVSLIPVFAVIRHTSWKHVWWMGFFFGFCFYIFFAYWLKTFHALAIILIPVIKAFEMMICFICLKAMDSFFKKYGYVFQSVIWVAYLYVSGGWFAGFPYGNTAYALYAFPVLTQIADITGIWGIALIVVMPQTFLGRYLSDRYDGKEGSIAKYLRERLWYVVLCLVLLILTIVYGCFKSSEWKNKEPDSVWGVVAVQHNHDSWKGGYTTYLHNFNNLRKLTLEAMDAVSPDIVVWSETAFVPSVSWHMNYSIPTNDTAKMVDDFVSFATGLSIPLVTGNPEGIIKDPDLPPILPDGTYNRDDYNTVILFDDGTIKETYRKQHLVPFTEYFPYEKELPLLYKILLANDFEWWLQGTESVVFDAGGVKFSTPICFEDTFGYLSADFVRAGADVIVNMSNDSWSQKVSAEVQHATMAAFRAIENRKSVLRSTNSGITCLITPDGRIHDRMEPFAMGWKYYDVPVYNHENNPNTFYTEHPDLFAKIALYASYILIAFGALLKIIYGVGRLWKRK